MTVTNWTEEDNLAAKQIWEQYQQAHDLTGQDGQTAGIDPSTGHVWLGHSIPDVVAQRNAAGSNAPLRFERVGSATYYQKGGRR